MITSNRSALREVVEKAAMLVDPESDESKARAIRALLEDWDRRQELIKLGQARARELSWNLAAQHVLQIHHDLA